MTMSSMTISVVRIPIEDALDLHAFAPRDIPSVVDDYLSAASERGLNEVRLVHGRGIGAQRAAFTGCSAPTRWSPPSTTRPNPTSAPRSSACATDETARSDYPIVTGAMVGDRHIRCFLSRCLSRAVPAIVQDGFVATSPLPARRHRSTEPRSVFRSVRLQPDARDASMAASWRRHRCRRGRTPPRGSSTSPVRPRFARPAR